MEELSTNIEKVVSVRSIKVPQLGVGNFISTFVTWIFDLLNTFSKCNLDSQITQLLAGVLCNFKDGLITDILKSSGALKKEGDSRITNVLHFSAHVRTVMLNPLCIPRGCMKRTNTPSGFNAGIHLFFAELGTPSSNPVAPDVITFSNTELAVQMPILKYRNLGL